MPTSTMTSKGQITVPKVVRDELGLVAGSKVSFRATGDGRFELVVERRSAVDLLGCLAYDGPTLTVDDMNAAIASAAGDFHA